METIMRASLHYFKKSGLFARKMALKRPSIRSARPNVFHSAGILLRWIIMA